MPGNNGPTSIGASGPKAAARPVRGPGDVGHATEVEDDPRAKMAQQYLASAQAEIAEETRKKQKPPGVVLPGGLDAAIVTHTIFCCFATTAALLAGLACYHLMTMYFTAGRVIALPAGMITAAALSYLSVCYLGLIETTSMGRPSLDDALEGGWQEWFWTLPTTLVPAILIAAVGYVVSTLSEMPPLWPTLFSVLILYPVLLISILETGSLGQPFSVKVLGSLIRRSIVWWLFYGISIAMWFGVASLCKLAWNDPPYSTMCFAGPLIAIGLLFYAVMLGRLARAIGSDFED